MASAMHPMTAEVYRQVKSQSASGQIVREWQLLQVIACRTVPNRRTSGAERWGEEFRYEQSLTLKTLFDLTNDDKVANIKDVAGIELYPGVIFDVSEIVALVDGFGRLSERDATLIRSEVQALE